jgi:hypothetical protein
MRVSKYEPLRSELGRATRPIEMSFAEVARLVGGLPPTAYVRPQWWSNNPQGHVQAAAWLGIGRRVAMVDLTTQRVRFE